MKCLFEKGEHDIMTSYETIMVIIAILNLLIAVYKINRK